MLDLEALDVKDLTVDGGKEAVFRELDGRFRDKLAADRRKMKNETTEAFTERARLLFTQLQREGVNLPSVGI